MADSYTSYDYALKEWYHSGQRIKEATYKKSVFLDMLSKNESFQGDVMAIPIKHANPQGFGGTRGTAQTNYAASNVAGKKFNLTVGTIADGVEINDKVIKASRGNPGAFLSSLTANIDGMLEQHGTRLDILLFGNGGAALGRRASISTNVITLTNPEDAVNFEVGMLLMAASDDGTDGSDSARAGSPTRVIAVDRSAGTVEVADASAITSFANNDYLFTWGSYGNTSGIDLGIKGLAAWIPASAPSSTSFYGVDRTTDSTRYGGVRLTTAEETAEATIEGKLLALATKVDRIGGGVVDTFLLNPSKWLTLSKELRSKGQYALSDVKHGSMMFGTAALELITPSGVAKVIADRHCPIGRAWGLELDSWKLYSMEGAPHFMGSEADGLKMLRKSATDDYEARIVTYGALACDAPGHNGTCAV